MKDDAGRQRRVAVSTCTRILVSHSGEPSAPTMYPEKLFMPVSRSSLRRVVG